MTDPAASRLARLTFGVIALGFVGGFAYGLLSGLRFDLFVATMFLFPIVGALITSQQPRNTIGWILLAIGFVWMLVVVTGVSVEVWKGLRGLLLALSSWLWVPGIGLIGTFLILLFPDGQLPSPRWKWWARLCGFALVVPSVALMFAPGNYVDEGYPNVVNPLGLEFLESFIVIFFGFIALIPICIVGCTMSLIQRFRRSEGQERFQLKWLAAGRAAQLPCISS